MLPKVIGCKENKGIIKKQPFVIFLKTNVFILFCKHFNAFYYIEIDNSELVKILGSIE